MAKIQVGQLSKLGISHTRQMPFILPDDYQLISPCLTRINDVPVNEVTHIIAIMDGVMEWNTKKTKAIYRAEILADEPLKVVFDKAKHQFDMRAIKKIVGRCLIRGELKQFTRGYEFEVHSIQDGIRWGKDMVVPVYSPGSSELSSHYLAMRMSNDLLQQIPKATNHIKRLLEINSKDDEQQAISTINADEAWTINKIVKHAHYPIDIETGNEAKTLLKRLSVYSAVIEGRKSCPKPTSDSVFDANTDIDSLSTNIPFEITSEQRKAVETAIHEIRSERPMRHILSGDVGTGKTVVYSLIAASVAVNGGRIMILTPNFILCRQVEAEIRAWFPSFKVKLIAGDSKVDKDDHLNHDILIGTTALISRIGEVSPDLCIIDEQQKFATSQREFHGAHNVLEATATCIPRTQALAEFGIYTVSRLRECHVHKDLKTRIYKKSQRKRLLEIMHSVNERDGKILVIYPKAVENEESTSSGLMSVEKASLMWEKYFPGKVAWLHGRVGNEQKDSVISQMRTGEKGILVATSVVEVGVDIPNIRLIIIVDADRFGAKELHQMRGRLARNGGIGYCILLVNDKVHNKPKTLKRLQILETTCDGFEVAALNLKMQGFGDLKHRSDTQRGSIEGFIPGLHIQYEHVAELNL